LLGRLISWIDEIPPKEQKMRFGNKSFRTWIDKLKKNYQDEMELVLDSETLHPAIPELQVYLLDSFGSYERIDYGTGHELNFLAFLI
jgi:predicted KAP-like P-loop ATPase